MASPVILPRQGQSVESCVIGEWHKKPGDAVKVGDILFTYETDKSTFEAEAEVEGTLLAVFCAEGDDVPCLSTVGIIGNPGEDYSSIMPSEAPEQKPHETDEQPQAIETASIPTPASSTPSIKPENVAGISPRARNAAERFGIDSSLLSPTGPGGRIIERDVLAVKGSATSAVRGECTCGEEGTGLGGRVRTADIGLPKAVSTPQKSNEIEFEDVKLSGIRKVIAKNMHASLSSMAQLTHHTTFDATALQEFRKSLKQSKIESPKITLNDMIMFAVSRVLKNHAVLNAHYLDDKMRLFKGVHLGMAVDTPRGLLVPTLFNADKMSLGQMARELKELASAAQEGTISPDLLSGATFTISNLGSLDIEIFTPVINPPQTGILGVNCITERIRTVDGKIEAYPAMGLSLTYDHRALDGAPASRFLKELKQTLESFTTLLIG